jgi:DNA-binding Lrp family transcriptional regulator
MDDIDRAILNAIQTEFPITDRPYEALGKRFDLAESEVLARVKKLKEDGIIRRIGGNFNSKMLNYTSTLCAAKVPEEKLDRFVELVNRYPGVTHNYLRSHEYNVWFTFIAPTMADIQNALEELAREADVPRICNLPAVKTFKIKVNFDV